MIKLRFTSGCGGLFLTLVFIAMWQDTIGAQKFCGPGLRQALELMCPNGFNGYKAKRGSLIPEDDYGSNSDDDDSFMQSFDLFPYFTNMEANSLAKLRRRRHGVTHECCDKPCGIDELRSYCRHPASK